MKRLATQNESFDLQVNCTKKRKEKSTNTKLVRLANHTFQVSEMLTNYLLISRRDRGSHGGGIALFAHRDTAPHVVHIADCPRFEKSWHVLHSDQGPVGICVWYRPPSSGEIESIQSLDDDMENYCADNVNNIIVGDMNVHNIEWLHHSSRNSIEGRELHDVVCSHGFEQHVYELTREHYLLDFVLSDFGDTLKAKVIAGISDHNGVLVKTFLSSPVVEEVSRHVFSYSKPSSI